ncbi:MAG: glycosyltransferase family 2 protein [Bacteroidia bacterium]|nr:glycosyltransferase family 2 protein [Bacteroidia bacterium]
MKDLSIIIVNFRGGEKLTKCLESIRLIEDSRFSFEVVVVDNQSNDGSLEENIRMFPEFTFISNTGNNGYANGCNLGASISQGRTFLFLNPDTTVSADALFDMLEEVQVRPQYSVVSCSQVREDGSKDRPYGKFLTPGTLTGWLRSIRLVFHGPIEDTIVQTKHYVYPDWVSGSVFMMKRDGFFQLGKWDEDFWMYFEDVDMCRRVIEKGGEVVTLKTAEIGHLHGGSSRLNLEVTVLTKTEVYISRHLYISKHENEGKAFSMHLILILNSLLLGAIPALLGTILFFIRPLQMYRRIYTRLVEYYFNVIFSGKWLSVKSVNYSMENRETAQEQITTCVNRA